MAPTEKKRHRDLASFKPRKRQRTNLENDDEQEAPKSGAIGLDKLPWNQVPVDRLEDAEGFFGLEELSDVDVVRDPTIGKVEYKVCKVDPLQISSCGILTIQCSFSPINPELVGLRTLSLLAVL